jgi:regulator of sigma E protease
MSTFWLKTFELIFSLGLLVFIHELGHYAFSRIFGVRVDKFYLFFNPWFTLYKYKPKPKPVKEGETPKASWRDTEYGIGWLPLGGYCAISGMIDESMNTEQMKQPAQPWEFRSKPAWQRLFIMIGGVLNNFLLAIIIYAGMVYCWGEQTLPLRNATQGMSFCDSAHRLGFVDGDIPLFADAKQLDYLNGDVIQSIVEAKSVRVLRNNKDTVSVAIPKNYIFAANKDAENGQSFMMYRLPVVISKVQSRMGAEKAGLQAGDRLVSINNVSTSSYDKLTPELLKFRNKMVTIGYVRNGKSLTAKAAVDGDGKLGIMLTPVEKIYKTVTFRYNIFESVPRGFQLGWTQMVNYVKQLKYIFTAEGAKNLGGFGTIGSIFPDKWDWYGFWSITAFLSIILAVMNILPIPALDGGHVMFLCYEMITRRKPSDKFLEYAQVGGMAFLILLLIFANGNDIYRFLFK